MTREEALQVLRDVSCCCDGYGVVPGPDGAVRCTSCEGRFWTNAQLKEARRVLAETEPCE